MENITMDDTALLLRYARHPTEADFVELLRRHLPGVYSSALRRVGGDVQLAEDVVQAVFTALALKASVVARHPYPTAWLYRVTRNEAANVIRTERRRKAREEAAAAMALNDSSDPNVLDWARVAPLLDELIDRLPTPDREAILRRFVDGESYLEIAAALNTTPDATRMRVERALSRLRDSFAKRGVCSTVVLLEAALAAKASAAIPDYLPELVLRSMRAAVSTGAASVGIAAAVTGLFLSPTTWLAVMSATAFWAAGIQLRQERQADSDYRFWQGQAAAAGAALQKTKLEASIAQSALRSAQGLPQRAGAASPRATVKDWDPVAEGNAFLRRHPEVGPAYAEYQDATTYARYAGLFRSLNLTPDQIQRFEELLRNNGFGRVVSQGVIQIGAASSPDEISAAQSQLQDLLGSEGYASYQTYNSTLRGREATGALASLLADSDQPLAPSQASQLTNVLNQIYSGASVWQSARAQAAQLLSPEQTQALDMLRSLIQSNSPAANKP